MIGLAIVGGVLGGAVAVLLYYEWRVIPACRAALLDAQAHIEAQRHDLQDATLTITGAAAAINSLTEASLARQAPASPSIH